MPFKAMQSRILQMINDEINFKYFLQIIVKYLKRQINFHECWNNWWNRRFGKNFNLLF